MQKQLLTKDIYKDFVVDFKQRKTVVKALCLHIAHDCNLACRYCFAEEGEYHGRRALMSYEVGKKALDFLIANSGNRGASGGGFFRRRASDELECGKAAGKVWPLSGGGPSQDFPFYHHHQRRSLKRRDHGILQSGNEQCGNELRWKKGFNDKCVLSEMEAEATT